MAVATVCQTPGVMFDTGVHPSGISIDIYGADGHLDEFTEIMEGISEEEAKLLIDNLHNAVELVLAPYFKKGQ